ncbi:pyridoxal phosphate-dependent decarboxylase family protein [Rudaeicoccus suwonensis]|uniref:L-2,4-diaminobutyrate decarboxylase n=1 Tax=Rudaeicoccus suwonensis TaxID=657409 RepID=A0A561E7Y8_9MICO|nr:pyridoxal-dependent decarboxylase [Rudaeicoccus suwonensis]TWE11734.1 L-2,4-diaminobutyrate decarboxylase [Rudaeicoccus suwonensis]
MTSPARLAPQRPEATPVTRQNSTTSAVAALLDNHSALDYERAMIDTVVRVSQTMSDCTTPFSGITPERLSRSVAQIDLDRPVGDIPAALRELDQTYLRDAVYFHHPRYLAHLNCPVLIPAVVADAVATAVNSSLDTWDQSAGGTLMERRLIEWTAGRIGFGPDADGIFTSGGTQSNLHALYLAREHTLSRHAPDDARRADALSRLRIFTSTDSHFSVRTAARMLGLSRHAVVALDVDDERRMSVADLQIRLAECRRDGLIPMAVVATAGTTDFGVIDRLHPIADVCTDAGDVWLHVDGAYGGGLLVSPTRRAMLSGAERAHSMTIDFHKSFFQPVAASALIVRDHTFMDHARHHADYLNPERMARAGIPNQVDKSLQTTRRFDALKLWFTLRVLGADAIGELFDAVIDLADEAWSMIEDDRRFEVSAKSDLSTVVFRYRADDSVSPEHIDAANLHARQALSASGAALVASTTVDGATYLKFTLLNPRTTPGDIREVVDLIADHCVDYLADVTDCRVAG